MKLTKSKWRKIWKEFDDWAYSGIGSEDFLILKNKFLRKYLQEFVETYISKHHK